MTGWILSIGPRSQVLGHGLEDRAHGRVVLAHEVVLDAAQGGGRLAPSSRFRYASWCGKSSAQLGQPERSIVARMLEPGVVGLVKGIWVLLLDGVGGEFGRVEDVAPAGRSQNQNQFHFTV